MSRKRAADPLSGLSGREWSEALRRERIVLEVNLIVHRGRKQGHRANDLIAAYAKVLASRGLRVSSSTISNWRQRYRWDGLAGLIDLRLSPGLSPVEIGAAYPTFIEMFLDQLLIPIPTGETARSRVRFAFLTACRLATRAEVPACTWRDANRWLTHDVTKGKGRSDFKRRSTGN